MGFEYLGESHVEGRLNTKERAMEGRGGGFEYLGEGHEEGGLSTQEKKFMPTS